MDKCLLEPVRLSVLKTGLTFSKIDRDFGKKMFFFYFRIYFQEAFFNFWRVCNASFSNTLTCNSFSCEFLSGHISDWYKMHGVNILSKAYHFHMIQAELSDCIFVVLNLRDQVFISVNEHHYRGW